MSTMAETVRSQNDYTPDYAVEAAADLLEPLQRYYDEMEERPTFNEFAFIVSDWFHTWMDDAYSSDEPLREAS
ncbi:hypothetical protein [Microbacterium lacus]|uniref:hypothetical protein n=1 Tax=Microbacterium lacus TaxID=415217 RepID=UPI000C2B91BA|nr:hypothetical protein [Microbacterium lacus]